MESLFKISPAVGRGLGDGRAVVALETAVLTHGLPYPINLRAYRAIEQTIREEGAVPAGIALVGGVIRVGLDPETVDTLARSPMVRKAGVADLAALSAAGADAGTTVASTLWAADAAGIRVFVTGGIGGVHPHAEVTFDVSGDLAALARYPGCVVCSGAKVILDLPRTLQLLETLGVCVVGYRTEVFPAFLVTDSGLRLAHRADDPAALARIVEARDKLGFGQSLVVANPPPLKRAVPRALVEQALGQAEEQARRAGVQGPAVTPFLLRRLAWITGGATIEANRALLEANARLGAQVAKELARPRPDRLDPSPPSAYVHVSPVPPSWGSK